MNKPKITPEMAGRILVLIRGCSVMLTKNEIKIMPGSKTFGGEPIENLTDELFDLIHGLEPLSVCQDIKS